MACGEPLRERERRDRLVVAQRHWPRTDVPYIAVLDRFGDLLAVDVSVMRVSSILMHMGRAPSLRGGAAGAKRGANACRLRSTHRDVLLLSQQVRGSPFDSDRP